MTMRPFAVIGCLFIAGCSLDAAGTADNVDLADSSLADTAVVESDTGTIFEPEDTSPTDSTIAVDSEAPDTELPDTAPVDTGTPDTGTPDTGPPDMGTPTPTVSVSFVSLGTMVRTYNLTTEGSKDWAHWGHDMTSSFNRKDGASAITKGMVSGASSFESGVLRFTWTDGSASPKSVTDTPRGLTMSSAGEYVSFDVQGDPTAERTLDVWISGTASGTATGTLTGSTSGPATASLGAGVYIVTFKFRTTTMASKLHVEVKKTDVFGAFNLFAAALN